MVFSSLAFIFYFFPIFVLVYWIFPRNVTILISSIVFYCFYDLKLLPVLIITLLLAYGFGLVIHKQRSKKYLVLGLVLNFGLLFYFKYFEFFSVSFKNLFFGAGDSIVGNIALPLGISFFTFQAASYVIDVYVGRVEAQKNLLTFATYKLSFPQLIAGPIVRYEEVQESLSHRTITLSQITAGLKIFTIGLSYKVLLANPISEFTDTIFGVDPQYLTVKAAWLGAVGYTFQLYFDFAGYSLMAIGLGKIMGFKYPDNFNLPYSAKSVTDFWRRWHMTLSRWFRDYLYIPLGGNRKSSLRTYTNLGIVFILCGLWHGAAFTFIFWGAYHGLFLIIERIGLLNLGFMKSNFVRQIYTWIVIIIGWVIFRSADLNQAGSHIKSMFGLNANQGSLDFQSDFNSYTLIVVLIAFQLSTGFGRRLMQFLSPQSALKNLKSNLAVTNSFYIALYILCAMLLVSNNTNPFIYFRF
jgi:alginate O-acetyltransferase complex protein AlgI